MDFGKRVEAKGMDKFLGEVVKAGYVESLLSATQAASGEVTKTQQLLLLWRPLDVEEEVKDQPAWYGMGGKGFEFCGEAEVLVIGKEAKEIALYPEIEDPENAPDITDTSWLGLLLDRCQKLGFVPSGTHANAFLGLKANVQREKYSDVAKAYLDSVDKEAKGTLSNKESIMPTTIVAKPPKNGAPATTTTTAPKASTEDAEAVLMKAVVGMTTEDIITKVAALPEIVALGLPTMTVLGMVDKLEKDGKIVLGTEQKYHLAG